jgi:hypothetical protein
MTTAISLSPLTEPALRTRAPVWQQLARLYLDTEHDDQALEQMARVLAASPYSVDQLREIEVWEVAPVVGMNAFAMVGAWDGFDEDWLLQQCERRARQRSLLLRIAAPLGFRRFVNWATGDYWRRLATMITAARAASASGAGP